MPTSDSETKADTAKGPLSGVKVLELATNVSAPLASMILAQQGADVIKVEPIGGDPLRKVGTQKANISAMFANVSRGKRSIALDIKSPDGLAIVRRLADETDVLLNNYRRGVMERLHLQSAELRRANPGLIFVSVWGFGKEGPLADHPAYDTIMQALLGFTDVQAMGKGREFIKTLVCDKITAYTACQAITAALFRRSTTGVGQDVDLSMLESSLFFLWPDAMTNHTYLADDVAPAPAISNVFKKYPVADGFITIGTLENKHWLAVFELMGKPDLLEDPRFSDPIARFENGADLDKVVAAGLGSIKKSDIIQYLQKHGVGCAPLQCIDEVLADPQVRAVNAIQVCDSERTGPVNVAMPPARFNGKQSGAGGECPALGEHSSDVLKELGFTDEQIHDLARRSVILACE